MGCCGSNRTVTDYLITFRDGTTQTVTHEEGGLARVQQIRAKTVNGLTYKAVPRKK